MTDSFGSRLRRERERRCISLASIAATTKIRASLFQALERDDVSRWPSGIFRRAFIRAYAEAIGLDADAVAREFDQRFPDPAAPAPAPPPAANPQPFDGEARRGQGLLRLTLADAPSPFSGGRLLVRLLPRGLAVACDAGVLLAVAVTCFAAVGQFWLPLGVTSLVYYLGSVLVIGNTPGVSLFAPRLPDEADVQAATAPVHEPVLVPRVRRLEPRRGVDRRTGSLRAARPRA